MRGAGAGGEGRGAGAGEVPNPDHMGCVGVLSVRSQVYHVEDRCDKKPADLQVW